ncbi:DUF4194 domain-containing protein [Anaerocolumna sp. AGMB13025]|uniref:DUF4194 domain-containing protein n=1 Tax=Anaerocolumna sp. AGMB13025 TaxID=3039116 RepID=UPI00241EC93D|nr:DUF4194 domain-containing protein [Anaerocolumna sp. AGMB13025]WFR58362.1 DUF4194 domain-containing protein [Anaerocolumna sp. AGMB13025]
MFEYYDNLLDEEKEELTELIKNLYSQTFILERKFDKKSERYQLNKLYRICERHYEFLREYFKIADIDLIENRQYGIMALRTQTQQGDKLSRLTTMFLLLLKLIFDEQMNTVSNSIQVYTTLDEIYDKLLLFRLWANKTISPTELRKTITVLKKYQVIEVMEDNWELDGTTRLIIYPTVSLILNGQSIQGLVEQYQENEEEDSDEQLPSTDEDVPEQLALYK